MGFNFIVIVPLLPLVMGFNFIVIVPLLPSHCNFSFVFFREFHCLPVDDCSAVRCDSCALARGSEHTSFYSAILNQSPQIVDALKISLICWLYTVYIGTTLHWAYWWWLLRIFQSWESLVTTLSGYNWQAWKPIRMISTLAADEWCWPESKLLLYLQLLSSSIKEKWDLNTKDLLSFSHSYNLDLGISCVLTLFSNFHLGISCGRRVWGVLSQLVTPESRHFCPQKHPRHVICQVTGVWTATQI